MWFYDENEAKLFFMLLGFSILGIWKLIEIIIWIIQHIRINII